MCLFCNNTDEKQIRKYGEIFGYPSCCINEFINDKVYYDKFGEDCRSHAQIVIAQEVGGFVPCKKHAEEIISGEISLSDIIINRDYVQARELNEEAEKESYDYVNNSKM